MSYRRSTYSSSIYESFSLNPLPYPVLLILAVIFLFLGLQWYVSYESAVEAAGESMGWLLMAAPLVLLFAVRWLSRFDDSAAEWYYWFYGDRRRRGYLPPAEGGGSPWGVVAVICLLLVLVQYQSVFIESWFV